MRAKHGRSAGSKMVNIYQATLGETRRAAAAMALADSLVVRAIDGMHSDDAAQEAHAVGSPVQRAISRPTSTTAVVLWDVHVALMYTSHLWRDARIAMPSLSYNVASSPLAVTLIFRSAPIPSPSVNGKNAAALPRLPALTSV